MRVSYNCFCCVVYRCETAKLQNCKTYNLTIIYLLTAKPIITKVVSSCKRVSMYHFQISDSDIPVRTIQKNGACKIALLPVI